MEEFNPSCVVQCTLVVCQFNRCKLYTIVQYQTGLARTVIISRQQGRIQDDIEMERFFHLSAIPAACE
jgi:hypothetical protein